MICYLIAPGALLFCALFCWCFLGLIFCLSVKLSSLAIFKKNNSVELQTWKSSVTYRVCLLFASFSSFYYFLLLLAWFVVCFLQTSLFLTYSFPSVSTKPVAALVVTVCAMLSYHCKYLISLSCFHVCQHGVFVYSMLCQKWPWIRSLHYFLASWAIPIHQICW